MSFCPFMSTEEKKVECSDDCALFSEEIKECTFKRLYNIDNELLEICENTNKG